MNDTVTIEVETYAETYLIRVKGQKVVENINSVWMATKYVETLENAFRVCGIKATIKWSNRK